MAILKLTVCEKRISEYYVNVVPVNKSGIRLIVSNITPIPQILGKEELIDLHGLNN